MRLIVAKDYEEMSRRAADILAAQVILKPDCVLGLATGSSPIGTYQELIRRHKAGEVDFSRCSTVNLDEYVGLPADHDQSYAYFMRHNLFEHVNFRTECLNIPNGLEKDAQKECARYDGVIRELGGIDMQLLGLGPNGTSASTSRTTSSPPGPIWSSSRKAPSRPTSAFLPARRTCPAMPIPWASRDIMQARRILMVVSGKGKAEILRQALLGPVTPRVPASILQLHRNCVIVADEEAASQV